MIPSVLVAIPTGRGGWAAEFCFSFLGLLLHPLKEGLGLIEEPRIPYQFVKSSNVCQNRHDLVRAAQNLNTTHILWLDDDMTFPADTLLRLLKSDEMIVGANCTTRALPIVPTAVLNDMRITSAGKSGLQEIDEFGLAVVLVNMDVYRKLELPWFQMQWDPAYPDTSMTEDHYFFRKARQAGFRVYIDHDLSNQIGHIGEITYDHAMVDEDELVELNRRSVKHKRVA